MYFQKSSQNDESLTLSNKDMVALRAPSGRPKGKTKRKLVK